MSHNPSPFRWKPIIILLILVSFLAGVWIAVDWKGIKTAEQLTDSELSLNWQTAFGGPTLSGSYLAGRYARLNNDYDRASLYLKEALNHDEKNSALVHDAMRTYLASGDVGGAIDAAKSLQDERTADGLINLVLLSDGFKQEDATAVRLLLAEPADQGVLMLIQPLLSLWVDILEKPETVVIDEKAMAERAGFLKTFYDYQLALMFDVLNQPEKAELYYRKGTQDLSIAPLRTIEAYGNFLLRKNQAEKAKKLFDDYKAAQDDPILLPVIDTAGDHSKVEPLVRNAQEGVAEILFTTGSLLFGETLMEETLFYLRLALYLKPDYPPAQMMLANILERQQDYKSAIAVYEKLREHTLFGVRANIRVALNYEALDQSSKAISLLQDIAAQNKKDAEAYISMGDIYRSDKHYTECARAYDRAISLKEEQNRKAGWNLYFARGICRERANNWKEAEQDFMQALKLNPDQPDVLNYLGYSWLVQEANQDQALAYIQKALELEPSAPHIIDSMGWAYFQLGEWKKAVKYLEEAVDLAPQDATVNHHLGDAYWRVGRKVEAQFQWKRALTFKPDTEEEQAELKNKIKQGLPPVDRVEQGSRLKLNGTAANASKHKAESMHD